MTEHRKPTQAQRTQKPGVLARSRSVPIAAPKRRTPAPLAQLQRVLGNRRVVQLIRAKRLTVDGKLVGIRRETTVGAADDVYEQEADRVARDVLSMPDADAAVVNRQPEAEPTEDEEALLQARSDTPGSGSFEVSEDVESRLRQSKGGGSPLPDAVRDYMEPRFGADFSDVRVHVGSDATRLNRDVGAKAFTHGSDIYYGATESPGNLELTAHELTHVVQQTGGGPMPEASSSAQRLCAECGGGMDDGQELQRTLGDGHDLSAARFAGDPVLEACFDNERLLKAGASGDAVVTLQQALVDAGFPLPKFGVDGKFGSETEAAVRAFQKSSGIAIDGLVGPQTMGSLDARFAGSGPPVPPVPVPPAPVPPAPVPPAPVPVPPTPVPPIPVPPVPVPPVPVPPVPVPPVATLSTDLQALIDAKNTTYADYKAKIVAAPLAQRATVLADTAMLRNIQGLLARNNFAKVVELLGRSAPSAGTMLGNATVRSAMNAAFTASSPAITLPPHNPAEPVGPCNPPAGTPPPASVHEEGGWIYLNLITGNLDTRRAAAGGQAAINLGGPPDVADSVVVGTFHTHPNVGPCWGAVFPSGTDTNSANGTGVPWLIIGAFPDVATTQTTSTGPGQRLHLAGNRGFPGATGGDAPQATTDGTFDEI